MIKLKKDIREKYKSMSDKEFNLIWSFIMDDDLIKLFIEDKFEQKYRRFR